MITLKKFHPDAPEPTHEVTKDIDLKELFNVVKSKQRSLNELKTHYDSLVSYEEVNENFLSRREEFPMETQLDMNHNSITNLKDPQFGGEAATKSYADGKLALTGGRMTGSINMEIMKSQIWQHPLGAATQALKNMLTILTQPSGGKSRRKSLRFKVFSIKRLTLGRLIRKMKKSSILGNQLLRKMQQQKILWRKVMFPKAGCNKMYFCIRC